jgi:hypothetical protein
MQEQELGQGLVRIRLKSTDSPKRSKSLNGVHFASVPFSVNPGEGRLVEPSVRSRGFKFALISGLAAYLAKSKRVIVPESGIGALGPVLVPVGQAYEDYRSYPLFAKHMENFLSALLGYHVVYEFPQLWKTKGETLKEYASRRGNEESWMKTRSCWQQNRHVSVNKKARQCGICAACMLRRLSVHAAGLEEPKSAFVWERLSARSFKQGAASSFEITNAMGEYAIAGVLHLAHLAELRHSAINDSTLNLRSAQLAGVLGISATESKTRLERLLIQHKNEWEAFLNYLGPESFVSKWSLGR